MLGALAFGALVLMGERGQAGWAGRAAATAADLPATAKRLAARSYAIVARGDPRPDLPSGWTFAAEGARPDGYVLLSRYDGTIQRHVVELWDLREGAVKHRWMPDPGDLLSDVARTSVFPDYHNWDDAHFRLIHPYVTEDGHLIAKDHWSPLFRLDGCARRVWAIDDMVFHHSTEADAEGNLWVGALTEPQSVPGVPRDFYEDTIASVSPDGEVLFRRSLTDLLIRDGFGPMFLAMDTYVADPLHLNDIEPVLEDGPFWRKGDLFISLRNLSMILLYRPSEDRILWWKVGPWTSQHDVDILDGSRISVYDNAAEDRGTGRVHFPATSDIVVYDFASGSVARPWTPAMEQNAIRTAYAGLATVVPGSDLAMIEDVTNARLLFIATDGSVAGEYVNRAEDGLRYQLGWSRFIDRESGNRIVSSLEGMDCDG